MPVVRAFYGQGWRRRSRLTLAPILTALAVAAVAPALAAAAVRPMERELPNQRCANPGDQITALPWAQKLLAPDRAWPLSSGSGVTVAVLDSGVDAKQPQLAGHVSAGADFLDRTTNGTTDCAGHGTQVAGIIAAAHAASVGFRGIAPGATILPIRVSEEESSGGGASAGAAGLVAAINWAVTHGAGVLNISMTLTEDDPRVRAEIDNALNHNVVVVAAAGNAGGADEPNPTPYPAAYPGVIGVGAIDESGNRWAHSQHGSFVDLVAPGAGVVTTQRGGGLVLRDGTSYATAFVSATAALVRSRWSSMPAKEVSSRLLATATPAAAGVDSDEYGYGVVSPYHAVSDQVDSGGIARPLPGLDQADLSARKAGAAAASTRSQRAMTLSMVGLALAVVLLLLARAVPLARRRGWRAGFTRKPVDRVEEEVGPPVHLFPEDAPR